MPHRLATLPSPEVKEGPRTEQDLGMTHSLPHIGATPSRSNITPQYSECKKHPSLNWPHAHPLALTRLHITARRRSNSNHAHPCALTPLVDGRLASVNRHTRDVVLWDCNSNADDLTATQSKFTSLNAPRWGIHLKTVSCQPDNIKRRQNFGGETLDVQKLKR